MNEPNESKKSSEPSLMEHAKALGMLCMCWAQLDLAIVIFLEKLLNLDEKTNACITSTARDTSQRCEIARRLVILKAPNDVWRDCLVGMLDRIQNEMAPKRNRYIHDDWVFENEELIQFERRVKIQKPQARQAFQFIHSTPQTSKPKDIIELAITAMALMIHIIHLGDAFKRWRATGQQPIPPEEAIRMSKAKDRA